MNIVLVPGLMCDAAVWRDQAAALAAIGDVLIADHADSSSLGGMAERILDTAPPTFALAGHSMGGRVALEVIARAPQRVRRLALLDTGFEALAPGEAGERERAGRLRLLAMARAEGMRTMAEDWARGMVHPARLADAPLMESIHAMIARSSARVFECQIHALLDRPDRTALLGDIGIPTLVLCGHEDAWSPLARHEDMARRIRGSRLVDVPDCGHMCTMERPEAVGRALLQWLA
jgi:pimeloyl-ACP methyl ester carboxylesterase